MRPAKKNQMIVVVLTIVVAAFYFYFKSDEGLQGENFKGAIRGESVKTFQGKDLNGSTIDLSVEAKKHKVLVLNFWETWCGPCREEMPDLQKMFDKHKSNGLGLIAIYETSTAEDVKKMVEELTLKFPIMQDAGGAIMKEFKIRYYPTTVVVDSDLKVIRSYEGVDLELGQFLDDYFKPKA